MKKTPESGLTLLELMVAISISGIVITLVLTSWDYINRHVAHQESRVTIRNETARVAEEIQIKLRRSPGVLRLAPNSLTFLEGENGGTIEYAFDGSALTKNGAPVYFDVRGGAITFFKVHQISAAGSEHLLLEITLASQDARNNRDTSRFTINVKQHPEP